MHYCSVHSPWSAGWLVTVLEGGSWVVCRQAHMMLLGLPRGFEDFRGDVALAKAMHYLQGSSGSRRHTRSQLSQRRPLLTPAYPRADTSPAHTASIPPAVKAEVTTMLMDFVSRNVEDA